MFPIIFVTACVCRKMRENENLGLTSAASVGSTEDGALLYCAEGSEQLSDIVFSLLLA